ncbi:hypothetical protein [Mobilicoccus caccae]|uniref:SprT-like family protein n=1 Tax=Mobilicoccus caccae TaxID=1859295 RepID=A0ABQ6IWU5_9MICO|nr:hypothetical protein [Mobilicoccus caccae]GMA42414.1 hypothetical protein GCM10025883_44590 [Mobilicoccus caccae]
MSNETTAQGMAASRVVAAVEDLWAAFQATTPEIPDVVVTFGAGSIGTRKGELTLGHFAARRWVGADGTTTHELFVGGEGLALGAVEVTGTLLHEAAHALAHARGIKDTSRQGRYHNTKFRQVAESLGLTIHQVPGIGWSGTAIPTATAGLYADQVAALARAIRAYRTAEGGLVVTGPEDTDGGQGTDNQSEDEGEKKAPKNGYALTCECEQPRKIRASRAVALAGPIVCGVCHETFTHPDLIGEQVEPDDDADRG